MSIQPKETRTNTIFNDVRQLLLNLKQPERMFRGNEYRLFYCVYISDEEILGQGIQFNEALQYIIEKHDAIASGSPLPLQPLSFLTHQTRLKHVESTEVSPKASSVPSAPLIPTSSNEIEEEENNSSHTASRQVLKSNPFRVTS